MMIDVPTTIMLLLAFTAGTIIALIIKKGKKKPEISQQIEILMAEKESLLSKLSSIDNESNIKVSEIKKQYELLLQEANLQYEKLDKQLKNALDGIIDDSIKKQLAEVEELKKKIKGLEEELEENEEDLSELKKRVKNKDNNIADLQNSLHKEQKESKLLNEELSSVRLELEEKAEELHLRTNSLVFLQEILSAKENTVEDIKTLYLQIDTFEAFIKGHFTELNAFLYEEDKSLEWNGIKGRKGFEEKRKFFIDTFDQWASTKRKSWLDGKTTIAFVGEFSAGKTSIVNRILSQDNPNIPQLPVSTKATTAIPTYIAGGPTISYSFISGDGKRKTIAEETFKKVSKDILDQVKGVSALIKYFVMTYKNANLDGLSILDTPGFNSNDREDKERTIDVINECDALFGYLM
ncbi:dynamin family protein [Bacteroides heparinolyticus]|uniref:dynamin family protein n=1 Tax=Prevotella heparinolytica TaxID=28113 RepID=UPI0028E8AD3C|nr:dynamin family protein [Bacteroides heparinolyticus]